MVPHHLELSTTAYLVRLLDVGYLLPVGWVDGGEGFPAAGVHPFIVDEDLGRGKKEGTMARRHNI